MPLLISTGETTELEDHSGPVVASVYITPTYAFHMHAESVIRPFLPVRDTERGWLGLASLVPRPHLSRISLCAILKAIHAGVGLGLEPRLGSGL